MSSPPTNASTISLATVRYNNVPYRDDPDAVGSINSPLLSPRSASTSYGTTPLNPPNTRKLIYNAAVKMAAIFAVSCIVLGGTLWLALPTLEEADRPMLKIPKSFQQLQDLNTLLKKYRDIYPYRIVVCYVITYLFLQAFSLPGSMYLSILGGAVWGVPRALPLACACVATGATLCYLISAALGPALLTLPKFQRRLSSWAEKVESQKENIISFLIVIRIAPLPPHWVVNMICPHVGIGVVPFWISTFLGVFGVSVIHTTIGGGLDEMTSADDFHLISWKNFLGLSAVVIGVMIPVGLRYYFRGVDTVVDVEQVDHLSDGENLALSDSSQRARLAPQPRPLINLEDEGYVDQDEEEDDDSDVILEAGPAMEPKSKKESESVRDLRDLGAENTLL